MGTNFYRKTILTDAIKDKYRNDLEKAFNDENTRDELVENIKNMDNEIHICKRSCGWKIIFDHNYGNYYKLTRQDIDRFLREPGTKIVDEYGTEYTVEQFWEMVDEWNANPRNRFDSKSYNEYLAKNGMYEPYFDTGQIKKIEKLFGVDCDGESDFESDGLRFSVYSNFS